jgi:amino-acid N-acetyltransferase
VLYKVEKARIGDVNQIRDLVNYFAGRGEMLARPLSEIYENLRDYFVVRDGDRVLACAALHISWADLAEVKALAVTEELQRQSLGRHLVRSCLLEAKQLGLVTVFTLTYKPAFFEKMGFAKIDKSALPHKVWGECYLCPKFPNCDEVALICRLEEGT